LELPFGTVVQENRRTQHRSECYGTKKDGNVELIWTLY
jgi:hypothetical protein